MVHFNIMDENVLYYLRDIAGSLNSIANSLEEANKPKKLEIPSNWGHGIADCVSKEEVPLPTPWNGDNTPSCKSDILYKEPEKPNWYSIKDNEM
jgi:hypothetical protein